jgi:hypothetical protein
MDSLLKDIRQSADLNTATTYLPVLALPSAQFHTKLKTLLFTQLYHLYSQ